MEEYYVVRVITGMLHGQTERFFFFTEKRSLVTHVRGKVSATASGKAVRAWFLEHHTLRDQSHTAVPCKHLDFQVVLQGKGGDEDAPAE